MTDLMTDGRIDSTKVGAAVAEIKEQARAAAAVLGPGQALEPALTRMAELVYELAELVKAERAKADGQDDTTNALARRALLIFREDTIGIGRGEREDYSATEAAVAAYARAAGIDYNAAMAATLEAYKAHFGKPHATPGQPG